MKRFLTLILILSCASMFSAEALLHPTLPDNSLSFTGDLNAESCILMDMKSGTILYEYLAHEKVPIASITKIMSLLLICESLNNETISLEEEIVTSQVAYEAGLAGTSIYLEPGEVATVEELLTAVAVASANDAATALAEKIAGTQDAFVAEMNEQAAELGMTETLFKDPCGLDDTAYSTAYDIALMSHALMESYGDQLAKYFEIYLAYYKDGTVERAEMLNTNRKFLRAYPHATGLKTGWTTKAGFCLSATAYRENMHLNAVVLGCDNSKERYNDVVALLNYGFAQFDIHLLADRASDFREVSLEKGAHEYVKVVPQQNLAALTKKGDSAEAVTAEWVLPERIPAPVHKGDILGTVTAFRNGIKVGEASLICAEDVDKASFWQLLKRSFRQWSIK